MKTIIKLVLGGLMITFADGDLVAGAVDTATSMIAQFEGFTNSVYTCPGGQLTIGYGFTDKDLIRKGSITKEEAQAVLRKKVVAVLSSLDRDIGTLNLSNRKRAALCSFVYNVGEGNWKKSTLRKLIKAKAKNDVIVAEIRKWHFSQGISLGGLVKRRDAEAKLWGS